MPLMTLASLTMVRGLTCNAFTSITGTSSVQTCDSGVQHCARSEFAGTLQQGCDDNPGACTLLKSLEESQGREFKVEKCYLIAGSYQWFICKGSDFGATDATALNTVFSTPNCPARPITTTQTTGTQTTIPCILSGTADCAAAGAEERQYGNCRCPYYYTCSGCDCQSPGEPFTWFSKACSQCKCIYGTDPSGLANGATGSLDGSGKILAGVFGAAAMMLHMVVHG